MKVQVWGAKRSLWGVGWWQPGHRCCLLALSPHGTRNEVFILFFVRITMTLIISSPPKVLCLNTPSQPRSYRLVEEFWEVTRILMTHVPKTNHWSCEEGRRQQWHLDIAMVWLKRDSHALKFRRTGSRENSSKILCVWGVPNQSYSKSTDGCMI